MLQNRSFCRQRKGGEEQENRLGAHGVGNCNTGSCLYCILSRLCAKLEVVTVKEHIAEIRAMLTSVGAAVVYHDEKVEAHDRQIEALILAAEEHREQMKHLDARIA